MEMETAQEAPATEEMGGQEAPPPETEVENDELPKQDDELSRRFAALARKERLLQQRESEIRERLRTDPEYLEFQKFKKAREAGDYREKLSYLGTDYNRLTKALLGEKEEEKDPATLAMERVEALERQLKERDEALEKKGQEDQEKEREKIESAAKLQIKKECEADPDKYELINLNDAHDMVYDVILEWYLKNNEILPTAKAAELLEAHLETQIEAKFAKSKKIRSKLLPGEQTQGEGQREQAAERVAPSPKTMTSRVVANGARVNENRGYLSDEESKRLIAEKIKSGAYKR